MGSPWQKKTARLLAGGFFGFGLFELSRSLPPGARGNRKSRKTGRRRKEAVTGDSSHPLNHNSYLGHNTIWVQRKSAILVSVPSSVTCASHTWVVRPRWTGVARHAMAPSRAVPRKFALSSSVVKPLAPGGRCATQP